MENEEYIESGLSVGAVKYVDPNEIITEEEYNYIKNKTPELNGRVGVIEGEINTINNEIEEINSSLDNKADKSDVDNELSKKIDTTNVYTKNEIDGNLLLKRDKNTLIRIEDLHYDVKVAMTGGSVAVTGENSVGTSELKDNSVTDSKLAFKNIGDILYTLPSNKNIELINNNGTLQIKIINSDLWFVLPNGINLDFQPSSCSATLPNGCYDSETKTYTFNLSNNNILVYNIRDNNVYIRNSRLALMVGDIALAIARNGICQSGVFKKIKDDLNLNNSLKNTVSVGTWKDTTSYIKSYAPNGEISGQPCNIEIKPRYEICLPNGYVILFNNSTTVGFTVPSGTFSDGLFTFSIPHNKTLVYDTELNACLYAEHYSTLDKHQILLASASSGVLTGGLLYELILREENKLLKEKVENLENKIDTITFGDITKNTLIETINYEEIVANKYRNEKYKTTYWLTKIPYKTLDDTIYKPRLGFIGSTLNEKLGKPSDFAKRENCVLTINGGTYFTQHNKTGGMFIQDGVVLQEWDYLEHWESYILGFKNDNTLKAYPYGTNSQEILSDGVINACTGFVPLIQDKIICGDEILSKCEHWNVSHPRQIICQMENKDLLFFTCDGRIDNEKGLTLKECAEILSHYNDIVFAYNLDGGGSCSTVIKNKKINRNIDEGGEREVPNFIYFKK